MSPRCSIIALCGVALSMTQLTDGFVVPGPLCQARSFEALSRSPSKGTVGTTRRKMAPEEQAEDTQTESENKRTKAPSWMFNDQGVAYAPWMVDAFDPENLAKVEAAIEERKKRDAEAVPEALGMLGKDPQQMELSGAGLTAKRVMGDSVELTWQTGEETGNLGFIVSRRAAKTEDWQEIASFKTFAPLNSKGPDGGSYAFVDEDVEEGSWVYRVSDLSQSGARNDLCQTLITLETTSEALQAKIGLAGLVIALLAAAAAGTLNDPFQ